MIEKKSTYENVTGLLLLIFNIGNFILRIFVFNFVWNVIIATHFDLPIITMQISLVIFLLSALFKTKSWVNMVQVLILEKKEKDFKKLKIKSEIFSIIMNFITSMFVFITVLIIS